MGDVHRSASETETLKLVPTVAVMRYPPPASKYPWLPESTCCVPASNTNRSPESPPGRTVSRCWDPAGIAAIRLVKPEPDTTILLIVRDDWFLMVMTGAREHPAANTSVAKLTQLMSRICLNIVQKEHSGKVDPIANDRRAPGAPLRSSGATGPPGAGVRMREALGVGGSRRVGIGEGHPKSRQREGVRTGASGSQRDRPGLQGRRIRE